MSRELDAQIAEKVMGWKWLYHPAIHRRALRGDWQHWRLEVFESGVDVLTEPDDLEDVPHYSTNLNLCALAEARVIEMGLFDAYDEALSVVMGEMNESIWHPVLLKMASAETRCRALLAALEAQS